MPSTYNPVLLTLAVDAAGQTKDIAAALGGKAAGRVQVLAAEVSGGRVFYSIGGTPPAAGFPAADGINSLGEGQVVSWNDVSITELSFTCEGGNTANIEIQVSVATGGGDFLG